MFPKVGPEHSQNVLSAAAESSPIANHVLGTVPSALGGIVPGAGIDEMLLVTEPPAFRLHGFPPVKARLK